MKSIQKFGLFVEIGEGVEGLVHSSELSDDFGVEAEDVAKVGDKVTVRVVGVDGNKIKLSMKENIDVSIIKLFHSVIITFTNHKTFFSF